MSKTSDYDIPISNLNKRLDGSLKLIRDAARHFHFLMREKLTKSNKSGKLYNSWKFELFSETEASVYSNLPYARIQDKGGKILITNKMRNFFWYKYKKTKNIKWKKMAITKKKYIIMPSKEYSNVNINRVSRYVEKRNPIKK